MSENVPQDTTNPLAEHDTIPGAMAYAANDTTTGVTFTDSKMRAQRFSYGQLVADGLVAAAALHSRGVGRGDILCFISRTEPNLVTTLLGVWQLGAIPTLIPLPRKVSDPGYLPEVERRVTISGAKAVVVSDEIAPLLPLTALPVPVLTYHDLHADLHAGDPITDAVATAEDIALLQFTSGTTSIARAVPVTHRQLLHNTAAIADVLAPRPSDVLMSWLPLYHDMGLISLVGTMMARKDIVIMSPDEFLRRPGSWMQALHVFGGTGTVAPNFAYGLAARDLARRKPATLDLSHVRCAMNGAEPVELDTLDAFAAAAAPYGFRRDAFSPMYGLAEATLAVTVTGPDDPLLEVWAERTSLEPGLTPTIVSAGSPGARRLAACGRPIADTEVRVMGPDGTPLPTGTVGEIAVRGPGVMSGYWFEPVAGDDMLTADGWLRSGDIGFGWQAQWYICGRRKDMMILGGRNFYPEDYESIADHLPGLRFGHAVAFALPDVERMVLVAELRAPAERADAVAREVMEAVRARLNHAPHHVVIVRQRTLPRTSSGKRQRSACRDLYLSESLHVLGEAR